MKNNLNNLTNVEKVKIIDSFCRHLKKGYSEYSFKDFDYRDVLLIANEIDNKMEDDEQKDKIDKAFRESFYFWENLAFEMVKDDKKKFFFPVWIFYVKSRFHWGEKKRKKDIPKNEIENIELKIDNQTKVLNEG